MKYRILALLLATAGAACSADREFDQLVRAIENHYGVRQTHIPLMGLANFVVKVSHPAGARGFKLAVFENLLSSVDYDDTRELDRFMGGIGGGLHPLVVTHSRRENASTYILAGDIGKTTRMLVATFDRHEATVVEVEVDIETLLRTIGSPDEARKYYRSRHDAGDRDW